MKHYGILSALLLSTLAVLPAQAEPSKNTESSRNVPAAAGRKAMLLSGKVKEVLTSGGYTYVALAGAEGTIWAAFPSVPVAVGQELVLIPGYEMKNFTSKGLGRTFERVVFSAGPEDKQAMDPNLVRSAHQQPGAPGATKAAVTPPSPPSPPPAPLTPSPAKVRPEVAKAVPPHARQLQVMAPVKVKKASGVNAYTVKQLHEKRGVLNNRQVVVRGTVVKVNPRILKQCWIHIQDGSGSAAKKNNSLVTTTPSSNTAIPAVGDVVTVTGTLHKDRDYGGGYRYAVILENSSYRRDGTARKP